MPCSSVRVFLPAYIIVFVSAIIFLAGAEGRLCLLRQPGKIGGLALFHDFSDRCANKRSLHLPPAAVACVARHARASFQEFYAQTKNTGTAKAMPVFLAGPEGLGVCCGVALHTDGSATEILRISVPASPLFAKNSSLNCFLNAQTLSGSSP